MSSLLLFASPTVVVEPERVAADHSDGVPRLVTYHWPAWRFLQSAALSRCDVAPENLALRQQLVVLTRSSRRSRLTTADRLFWSWLSRAWPRWRSALVIVQPDTVVRWHRTGWRRYWAWKSRRRGPGSTTHSESK